MIWAGIWYLYFILVTLEASAYETRLDSFDLSGVRER